jgi:hypothetical protein
LRLQRWHQTVRDLGEIASTDRRADHEAVSPTSAMTSPMWRAEAHGWKGKSGCSAYLPDLDQPRPTNVPPGLAKLRLVKKA